MSKGGGDYDYGHGDPSRLKSFKIKAYDFTSKSDMPVRPTSGYADNAMADPSQKNESAESTSMIERLHLKLSRLGVDDAAIRSGATLSRKGFQKLAAQFGISAEDALGLMKTLRSRLNSEDHIVLAEDNSPRYSAEHDAMFNVTVRDSETGKEFYYGGSKGAALVKSLEGMENGSPQEQAFLATYVDGQESRLNEAETDDTDFVAEIASDVTTFNFPWKNNESVGTATAQCRGGRDFSIELIDVRDAEGNEIDITPALEEALKEQAVDFIPEA